MAKDQTDRAQRATIALFRQWLHEHPDADHKTRVYVQHLLSRAWIGGYRAGRGDAKKPSPR